MILSKDAISRELLFLDDVRYRDLIETIEAMQNVVEATKKLVVHCNHKPEGWDEVDKALKPFTEEGK